MIEATATDLLRELEARGAILTGHFRLSSGRHSNRFVQKFRILEDPPLVERVAGALTTTVGASGRACAASAPATRSTSGGSSRMRNFCTKRFECRPDDSRKCPVRIAPRASSSRSKSVAVASIIRAAPPGSRARLRPDRRPR